MFSYKKQDKPVATPPVHVLMPFYDAKKFICRSVQSILDQAYPNLTIYMIDDGSIDGGYDHLREYLKENNIDDERIKIRRQGVNCGVSFTRTSLFGWSRNENCHAYILWLDSDDIYNDTNFISNVMSQMLKTQADMCLYNYTTEYEDKSQQSNAMVLMKDKEKTTRVLQAINGSPDQAIVPVDLPNLLDFTSLGWTKCYGPRANIPFAANCPYEDFVYMATLLQVDKITALPAEYEPITYLRRSTSICGKRTHDNFSHDIPTQLSKFFETVNDNATHNREKQLAMAKSFVTYKLDTYKEMLSTFVKERKFPDIDENTLNIFTEEAADLTQRMEWVILCSQAKPAIEPQFKYG